MMICLLSANDAPQLIDEFNRLTTKGTKVDFTGNSPEYLQRAVVEFNESFSR